MFIPQFAYSKAGPGRTPENTDGPKRQALTVYMSNELTKWEGTYDAPLLEFLRTPTYQRAKRRTLRPMTQNSQTRGSRFA